MEMGSESVNAVKNSEMMNSPRSGEKLVVSKMVSPNTNVRFVHIGIGQGGCKISSVLSSLMPGSPFQIAINTSLQDLNQVNIPDNHKFMIGGSHANGAGQNRNRAKKYFKDYVAENSENADQQFNAIQTFLGMYEEVLFHPTIQTIIIVSFTSDGGSGSGLGPMFVTHLTNRVNSAESFIFGGAEHVIDDMTNKVPRPVVVGLTPKCDINSGLPSLLNNIECFSEIESAITKLRVGNYFIADNNIDPATGYKTTEEMYNMVNTRIVVPLLKFLGIEMNSSIKCLDLQDKINILRIAGCSSFVSLTDENLFQYVVPSGQSVLHVVPILKYESGEEGEQIEAKAKAAIKKMNITAFNVKNIFFDPVEAGFNGIDVIAKDLFNTSMIGLFGFSSLSTIVEDLRERKDRLVNENEKKLNVVKENSSGFSTMKEDQADFSNRFTSGIASDDAINDLF